MEKQEISEKNMEKNYQSPFQATKKFIYTSISLVILSLFSVVIIEMTPFSSILDFNTTYEATLIINPILCVVLLIILAKTAKNNIVAKIYMIVVTIACLMLIMAYINGHHGYQLRYMIPTYISAIFLGLSLAIYLGAYVKIPVMAMANSILPIISEDKANEMKKDQKGQDLLYQLRDNALKVVEVLNQTLSENSKFSEDLRKMASELSSNAEEISASSENVASSQQQIAKGAFDIVNSINETQQQMSVLSNGIRDIQTKVAEITSISELIRGISEQTNMLALNAAIESARAGESGKGFNVVAEQVRKLAEQSKGAVQQTDKLVEEIHHITNIQKDNSVKILSNIDAIASVAEETSSGTEETVSAAEEQSAAIEDLAKNFNTLFHLSETLSNSIQKLQKQ